MVPGDRHVVSYHESHVSKKPLDSPAGFSCQRSRVAALLNTHSVGPHRPTRCASTSVQFSHDTGDLERAKAVLLGIGEHFALVMGRLAKISFGCFAWSFRIWQTLSVSHGRVVGSNYFPEFQVAHYPGRHPDVEARCLVLAGWSAECGRLQAGRGLAKAGAHLAHVHPGNDGLACGPVAEWTVQARNEAGSQIGYRSSMKGQVEMSRNLDCFLASPDLAGWEKAVEHLDGLGNSIPYAPQAWNDDDTTRPIITKLPKRYECGEFHPHIHFTVCKGLSDFMTCCRVFANAQQLCEIQLGSLFRPGADDGQRPMLVKAVHIMEDQNGVVRTVPLGDSVVWLQRLDDCAGLITDSLYFSVEQGKFVGSRRPRVEDWKLNSIGISGSVPGLPQKLPDEIVKRRAIVMQDFADEYTKPGRDSLLTPEVLEFLDTLGIAFCDFTVSLFIQKTVNLDIKVLDVLIGPFESFRDPF